ncbi:mycothiol synthase [Streptosporangium becharense]|uniref:Mycothiol acetyltransferase n=1 Tax=Streptosporangium becharense TaxID=1816182 RepID=A0A7W9IFL7_9ACTN|nr:mycothiol synthase [Streptosporangium becharense]MBB2909228.1 mycothiol synthase [Streptosporangium becharense]MBB5819753.1 mycothiol synthase [Streptosporangium becharense]
MNVRVEHRGRLGERQVSDVLKVVEAATGSDGVRPLNEHVMLHLRYGGDERARAVLLYAGDDLAGYAHVDPTDPVEGPSGELVIHPAFRRRGYGRRLLEAVLDQTGGRLRLWAHGGHPGAEAIAASTGFTKARSLWQMRRSLLSPIPGYGFPEGVRLRTFRPGTADEDAWVALNARAFAYHPEQGAWTVDDLKRREREPWFDPAGFFLAVRPGGTTEADGTESVPGPDEAEKATGSNEAGNAPGPNRPAGADGDRLAGFHWTKVHGDGEHAHEPIGEVYVVGVDPAEQGGGLGRSLTLAGLDHLRSRGLAQVMLYVDESNTAAIRLYEGLGFTRWDIDVMYQK